MIEPICEARLAQYPELEYVRDLSPQGLREADREDLVDAQHQWAWSTGPELVQRCFEEDCDVVRQTPFAGLPERDQVFILQSFIARKLSGGTT
jgi:hypothetical protein